jgi:hypothetical protein
MAVGSLETAATMSLVAESCGRLSSAVVHPMLRRWAEHGIDVLPNGRPVEPGVLPQPVRHRHRVDVRGLPPRRLIAVPVKGAMVGAAERHRELIADPAAQGPRLHESEVMGVARLPPAEQVTCARSVPSSAAAVKDGPSSHHIARTKCSLTILDLLVCSCVKQFCEHLRRWKQIQNHLES